MEPFKITDIKEEMIELGKKLYAENVQKYPSERVEWMRNSIKQLATESFKKDFTIDELFYLSIYDYWVYGNTISEEIYFHFPYKTHKEKSEYMTFRSRLKLMKRINNFEDSFLFNNKYNSIENANYLKREMLPEKDVFSAKDVLFAHNDCDVFYWTYVAKRPFAQATH